MSKPSINREEISTAYQAGKAALNALVKRLVKQYIVLEEQQRKSEEKTQNTRR